MHLLQRALNTERVELAPTQAAAIALNSPSAQYSHDFGFAYVWDAVQMARALAEGDDAFDEASADPLDEGEGGAGEGAFSFTPGNYSDGGCAPCRSCA